MRLGLLADVHANLPALQTALRRLDAEGVDVIAVAGDLVGYGASPNECIELLAERDAVCVAGNHDLFLLDRLPVDRFSERARRAAEVTRTLLGSDARSYLAGLATITRAGPALVAHGSLDDPEEYVEDRHRITTQLRGTGIHAPDAELLVLGHTHHQRHVRPAASRFGSPHPIQFVNPGSVGQSRARERHPRVRLAIYDTASARPDFLRLPYDVATAHDQLRELGLDVGCLHSPAPITQRVGRRLPRPVRARVKQLQTRFVARR